jgi:polysaccharide biosynthesis protein PslG
MRSAFCLAVACLFALVLASPAAAATPREFFGVMLDGPALRPEIDLAAESRLMASSGVGSVRVAFYWRHMQPAEDGPIDFADSDRVVGAAARAGLRVFPTVVRAPAWATGGDDHEGAVPRDPATYAAFVAELVRRYGRGGSFWASGGVRVRPIVSWQVWNEPDIGRYWQGDPWAPTYVRLLRAAAPAIKAVDPGAQVVAAGLTNESWEDLRLLYAAGARRWMDAAAIHPFSRRPSNVMKIVRLARGVMRRARDGSKPLVLTELSWSSGKGQSSFNYGWETTEHGQAERIRQILPMLARARRRLGIQALYWYTWLSPPIGDDESFSYAGLRRLGKSGKPVSKPALRAFKATVAKLR